MLSDLQLLDSLSRMPFIDSAELSRVLGEPHATIHRALTGLLGDGIVGRVSHGTAHLPSSQRYYLTANGVREVAGVLGFGTPSDFVRAYPVSREWLTLLIRRMGAVASVYRLAASLSPGTDGLRSPRGVPPQGSLSTPPSLSTTAAASALPHAHTIGIEDAAVAVKDALGPYQPVALERGESVQVRQRHIFD